MEGSDASPRQGSSSLLQVEQASAGKSMIPFQCTFKCAVSGDVEFFKTADKEVLLNARTGDKQDSTVLEISASGEHLDCCQEICKKCPELLYHQTPGQKMTILMSVAWFGKTDLITLFLNTAAEFEKGDKKLVRMLDSLGRSALYHAVLNSKFEAAKLLMEADPDFEYCYDNDGQIPLLAAMGRANSGDQIAAKIRKLILEMQPYQSKIRTGDKNSSAIHKAGFHGNLDAIKELTQFCPECAEYVDTNKCNFLHIAVFCQKINVLKHVLENKDLPSSVLNAQDIMGKTPLDYAASSEDKEMTKLATTYRHDRLRKGKMTRDDYGSSSTSFLPEIVQSIHDSLEEKFGSVKKDVASRPTSEILKSPDLCPVRSTICSIKGMFDLAKPLSSEYTIYRVPERLRSVKAEAYAPMLISVGPFHHDSDRLKSMESDKARYLYCMLHRENSKPLADYVEMAMKLERKARDCYAETFSYTKNVVRSGGHKPQ